MGLYRLNAAIISFCVLLNAISAHAIDGETSNLKNHILFKAHTGAIPEAIALYRSYAAASGEQDFELLNQLSLIILEHGSRSDDDEIKLLTYFGAGVCINEHAVSILESGLLSDNPQLQIVCLNFLSQYQSDQADQTIKLLFKTPNPLIQLEAAFCLAKKKHPHALSQTEAMMAKFPKPAKVVFPAIFACMETPRANSILRQLMNDSDQKVRVETILTSRDHDRDDFLPQIRRLSKHTNVLQQEACATALGHFKDEKSAARLEQMARSTSPHVAVAAAYSLYRLGRKEYKDLLFEAAEAEFPFAILLLKDVRESKNLLYNLTFSPKKEVRLNAAYALLCQRDNRCLPALREILMNRSNDLIVKAYSPSRAQMFLKYVPLATLDEEKGKMAQELSKTIRSKILQETMTLSEGEFLRLAEVLMESEQNELIPLLVRLLENIHTGEAVDLLKKYQQKIGAPLVRNYCNLALFRLEEPGPYEENLRNWLRSQYHVQMINFRPMVPLEMRLDEPSYQLTPNESSMLYVEAMEAITKSQGEKDVMMLLEAMEQGNHKNLYVLAGLLMRALQ
jgi:HEAT repeat protein